MPAMISFRFGKTPEGTPITIEAPPKYNVGQTLDEAGAALANRGWLANARAAFKETQDALEASNTPAYEVAKEFLTFLAKYEYKPQANSKPIDPVETEALIIAHKELSQALKDAGGFLKDQEPAALKAATKAYYEANKARLTALAESRLAAMV